MRDKNDQDIIVAKDFTFPKDILCHFYRVYHHTTTVSINESFT